MLRIAVILTALCLSLSAQAELAVVTSSSSSLSALSQDEVKQLFSGQIHEIRGQRLEPLDLPESDPVRVGFYKSLLNKSPDQMRSHWVRLVFTGRGQPPRSVDSSREQKMILANSSQYVGYLPAETVDSSLKVLLLLEE